MSEDRRNVSVYITTGGREVPIQAVSMLLIQSIRHYAEQELRGQGLKLDVPTYKSITVANTVEEHPHDATTLQTDEDKAAWAEYQAALARVESLAGERTTKAVLLKGIDLEVEDIPEKWIKQRIFLGFPAIKDENELMLEYIQTELLPSVADLKGCISDIMTLGVEGVDPAKVKAAQELFRGSVQRGAVGGEGTAEGALAVQSAIPGSEDREVVEPVTEPIPITRRRRQSSHVSVQLD
jgi:hypothetical protein